MTLPSFSFLSLCLLSVITPALGGIAGSFADGGNTQISAMMMFVGNEEKVYFLDKAENNSATINGHPAWGAVWDITSHQASVLDVTTNVFCASGMHLPNGSFVTFGGNGAVGPGASLGSVPYPGNYSASYDATYQDYDGVRAIRIINPCTSSDDFTSPNCQWFDNPAVLSMQKGRWYSAAEPAADGSIVIIGGFANGGYVNRAFPNVDPMYESGAAEPTYEFFPANGRLAQNMTFMTTTSGLNAYAHTFLMASGLMFVQANLSTILWDFNNNVETQLPNMPNGVARVYPASGATAMLPLTVANNFSQTILFCGGSDMPADDYGNYSFPFIDTWYYAASKDCQRITPEPADGSAPIYVQDDDMLDQRTMGQFIILPTGKLLVVNGAVNGTAGYAQSTLLRSSLGFMPYGESLAAGPVWTPSIYDPEAPSGQRWSSAGLSASNIPRLYHSSAILLADASVLIAGSNPNEDVNTSTIYPTTYKAEIFYPPYFAATVRPTPSGIPTTLSYGGNPFDITIPASSFSGKTNDAAGNTTVAILRPGFTTHAMNMGQRYLQLNNTFTVNSDGSFTLHVAQPVPNPNLFQPGPGLLFVVVNGVPSNGTHVIVGNGQVGAQPTSAASVLPPNVLLGSASGSASSNSTSSSGSSTTTSGTPSHTSLIIGVVVGGIVVISVLGALFGIYLIRRRRAPSQNVVSGGSYPMSAAPSGSGFGVGAANARALRSSDSSAFVPLQQDNHSQAWESTTNLNAPYRDAPDTAGRNSGMGVSMDYDPYASAPRMSVSTPVGGQRRY